MSSDEAEALPSVFVEHADVAVSLDEAPSLLSSAEVGSSDGAALTEHAPEAAEAEDATSSAKPGVFGDAAGENGTICGDALLEPGPIEHDDAMKQDDGAQLEDEVGDKDSVARESDAAEPGEADAAAEEGPPRRRRKASSPLHFCEPATFHPFAFFAHRPSRLRPSVSSLRTCNTSRTCGRT